MTIKTIFTLSLLALSLTNCSTKKVEKTPQYVSEKITAKKKTQFLKKRKRRKTVIAKSNRPAGDRNLVNSKEKTSDKGVKTIDISKLLPNFKAVSFFNFERDLWRKSLKQNK